MPAPCNSPAQYMSLADGWYRFELAATDRVGNSARNITREFLVDTTPPTITAVAFPVATRAENVTVTFAVSDGLAGSGVALMECRCGNIGFDCYLRHAARLHVQHLNAWTQV